MFFPESRVRVYVFVSRSGAQIKVLYFDRSGWCVWAKRLEAGRFVADWSRRQTQEIDCTQLKLLLEGIEVRRQRKRYRHEPAGATSDGTAHASGNWDQHRGARSLDCVACSP